MPCAIRKSRVLGDDLDNSPPDPADNAPPTPGQLDAIAMQQALESLDKSPQFAQLFKYLPYIIPVAVGLSALTWGTSIYIMYKKSKHYYG